MLPVAVLPSLVAPNATAMEIVEGLVDTGATGTGLRPDVAERLGIVGRGRRRVLTANGDMLVPEFRVRLGFFPGRFDGAAEVAPASFPHVLDFGLLVHALLPNFVYPILIGMDVLRRIEIHMKTDATVRMVLP